MIFLQQPESTHCYYIMTLMLGDGKHVLYQVTTVTDKILQNPAYVYCMVLWNILRNARGRPTLIQLQRVAISAPCIVSQMSLQVTVTSRITDKLFVTLPNDTAVIQFLRASLAVY